MINVYFPRCFLVTLFMVSFVLVSVVVMMRFLSEEVVKAFSSSASLIHLTSGVGMPWNGTSNLTLAGFCGSYDEGFCLKRWLRR